MWSPAGDCFDEMEVMGLHENEVIKMTRPGHAQIYRISLKKEEKRQQQQSTD
jgi:hypothetical protein